MLAALAFVAATSRVGGYPVMFPCMPGKTLTYRAKGQWELGAGVSTIIKKTMAWQTQFISCSYTSSKAVTIVDGLPMDLAWYQPGTESSMYVIIQTSKGLFIQQSFPDPTRDLQTIKPSSDDQYIGFPIKVGTCAQRKNLRPDGSYCWFVSAVNTVANKKVWTIEYHSLPDYSCLTIEPGVGITSYAYHHNGTVAEVNVNLVRAGRKPNESAQGCPDVNLTD